MRLTTILIAILLLAITAVSCASVPPMISYQGKLMQPSGVPVPDGTYSIRFAIYDVPTGGEPLWSETNSSVQVKGGLFATMLGSVVNLPANIFDGDSRFFGVKVGTDSEMTPRQRIASMAFAYKAASADIATTVPNGAITAEKLAPNAVTANSMADSSVSTAKLLPNAVTKAWEMSISQDMTYQDSYNTHPIPGASMTINTTGGPVLVLCNLDAHRINSVESNHTDVALRVDGVQVAHQWASEFSGNDHSHIAVPMTRLITGLAPGSHVIEVWSGHVGNGGSTWHYVGYLQCIELKR